MWKQRSWLNGPALRKYGRQSSFCFTTVIAQLLQAPLNGFKLTLNCFVCPLSVKMCRVLGNAVAVGQLAVSIVVAEYHMFSELLSRELCHTTSAHSWGCVQCHKLAACLWLSTSIDLQGCLLPPLLCVYTALLAQTACLSAGQHTQYSQHNLVLPC